MSLSTWPVGLPAAFLFLAGCDAQVSPGYSGEPVVSLFGSASSAEPLPAVDISAKLDWVGNRRDRHRIRYGEGDLVTRGEFPTHFVLDLLDGPAESWLNDFTRPGAAPEESRIGVAQLGAHAPEGFGHADGQWYAFSRQVLVFVEQDIAPGTIGHTFAGDTLSAGFHLLEVVDAPCDSFLPDDDPDEGTIDCLRPTPSDLRTPVDLRFSRDWDCDVQCIRAEEPRLFP
jgi:hypothetical protein